MKPKSKSSSRSFLGFTTSLSRALSLPPMSPLESFSLLWILLVQGFSSALSLSSNKANASCWERVVAQPLERSLHIFTAYCCSMSQKPECWCPRHIPFVQSPAEIPRKRYFCSSEAVECMKGVWNKEERVLGRRKWMRRQLKGDGGEIVEGKKHHSKLAGKWGGWIWSDNGIIALSWSVEKENRTFQTEHIIFTLCDSVSSYWLWWYMLNINYSLKSLHSTEWNLHEDWHVTSIETGRGVLCIPALF